VPEIAKFAWLRPKKSHQWVTGPSGQLWLTGDCTGSTAYYPFQEFTGLFRDFAAIEPTPEAILDFANKYGNLNKPESGKELRENRSLGPDGKLLPLGTPPDWLDGENVWLTRDGEKFCLALTKNPPCLAPGSPVPEKLTRVLEEHTYSSVYGWQKDILFMRQAIAAWEGMGKKGPLPTEAVDLIDLHVSHVGFHLTHDPKRERMVAVLLPHSLRAGLWLQLLFAIEGQRHFCTCRWCGRSFERGRSPEINRRTFRQGQEFCSITCRVGAHRQRKYRARELASEGKTAAAIAKELGSKKSAVEKWIAGIAKGKNQKSTKKRS
jgi:hypothetical protein